MSSEPSATATPESAGFLAPSPAGQPGSHCARCGTPTPPGVALCDEDNPGHITSPSATQVHGTIFAGVIVGAIGFFLLARLAVGAGGPYLATVVGRASLASGAAEVAITVANQGTAEGVATCRITRDGAPRPDDVAFRTVRIAPGAMVQVTRLLPAPVAGSAPYDLPRVSAICT